MADTPAPATNPASAPPAPAADPSSRGFFVRVFSRAGGYLGRITVYLGSIAALVAAYLKFIRPFDKTQPVLADWLLLAVAGVPLLIALAVEWSLWRERRRKKMLIEGQVRARHFALGPREAKDHPTFSLPDDAHRTVAEWVRAAPHPVLHLTGLSGVGKSSLVQAWLIPELEGGGSHRVIVLRSFEDPLDNLRRQLIDLWENPPARVTTPDLPLTDLLTLAARYLEGKNKRLLIIFDQFEEFFILHPSAERAEPLRAFFAAVLAGPPPGLIILLSYRKDHAHALARLCLPPVSYDPNRNLQVNGHALRPFSIAEARAFYQQSGLQISPERLDLALAEAASYEETRAHIRPIVLNVLGRILATLSTDARATSRARGLIRSQVREWALSTALQEDIRPVLEKLVSASGTVSPAHEAALSAAAAPHSARLPAALSDLEACGLLRCLSPEQPAQEQRLWQISHDFLARLLALITEGLNKTIWKTIRPWLAPAALGLWLLAAFVVWPHYQERGLLRKQIEAASALEALGFGFNLSDGEVSQGTYSNKHTFDSIASAEKWPKFIQALRDLQCRKLLLTLIQTQAIPSGLETVESLETLSLQGSTGLKALPDLNGLGRLKELYLDGCTGLEVLPDLSGLGQLKTLNLSACTGLKGAAAFAPLAGLSSLEALNLQGCTGLEALPDLNALGRLKKLKLTDCTGLKGMAAFAPLAGLGGLEELSLWGCTGLEVLPDFSGLGRLRTLYLNDCTGLKGVAAFAPLAELGGLEELCLWGCTGLDALPDLSGLGRIKTLILTDCTGLKGSTAFAPLAGLGGLEGLYLMGCTGLEVLPDLSGLGRLRNLILTDCIGLKDAAAFEPLAGLGGLEELDVNGCTGLDEKAVRQVREVIRKNCQMRGPDGREVKP